MEVPKAFIRPNNSRTSPALKQPRSSRTVPEALADNQPVQTTLAIQLSQNQPWTASVFPPNVTTGWLSVSKLSGTGPASITLTALGTGFEPGAYQATLVIQCANAVPQYNNVAIRFVEGGTDLIETLHSYGNQIQIAGEQTEDLIRSGITEAEMSRKTRDTLLPAAGVRTGVRAHSINQHKDS